MAAKFAKDSSENVAAGKNYACYCGGSPIGDSPVGMNVAVAKIYLAIASYPNGLSTHTAC